MCHVIMGAFHRIVFCKISCMSAFNVCACTYMIPYSQGGLKVLSTTLPFSGSYCLHFTFPSVAQTPLTFSVIILY